MAFPIAALIGIGSQLIEKLIPDPQAKAEATQRLVELQQAGAMRELDAQLSVLVSEMSGNWLQRSWRPITMLTFLLLVVCDSFGLLAFRLADEAWTLLQLGLGGYVVGRSGEKIMKEYKK